MKLKTRKILKGLSFTLLSIGCIAPIVQSSCSSTSESYDDSIKRLAKRYALKEEDVIESDYSSFKGIDQDFDDPNVTATQLENRIKAIEDKAQYQMYAAGCSDTEVAKTVGLLEKNISNEIDQQKIKTGLKANQDLSQDSLNQVYSFVNQQADILDFEVVDFDRLYSDLPSIAARYEYDLESAGVSEKVSIQKATEYKDLIEGTMQRAQSRLMDNASYSLLLQKISNNFNSTLSFLKYGQIDELQAQQNEKDAELDIVLSWIVSNQSKLLTVREDGLINLKDYSNNNKGLVAGDVLNEDQISSLFNYKYNIASGYDPMEIRIQKDIPEADTTGDYSQDTLDKMYFVGPLDTLEGDYRTYGKNEVLPGYKLHAKILSIQNEENSHEAQIQFVFGISKANDSTGYILWDKNDKANAEQQSSFSVAINSYDLIKNISQNVYTNSPSSKALYDVSDAIMPSTIKPNTDGIYFSDSAEDRTKINEVLKSYSVSTDDEYDLKKNPIILDEESSIGIVQPKNIANILLDKTYHTNQQLVLIADDVDTNKNTLSIHWAIVDKDIQKNSHTDNNFYVIKNIPWNINGQKFDSIIVQYALDRDIAENIAIAMSNSAFSVEYTTYVDNLANVVQSSSNDSTLTSMFVTLTSESTMNAIQIVTEVALSAIIIIYSARAISTLGADADAVLSLGLGLIFATFCAATIVVTTLQLINAWNNYNKLKDNAALIKSNMAVKKVVDNSYQNIKDDIEVLTNPHATYDKKNASANKINEVSLTSRTETEGFLREALKTNMDLVSDESKISDDMVDSLFVDPRAQNKNIPVEEIIFDVFTACHFAFHIFGIISQVYFISLIPAVPELIEYFSASARRALGAFKFLYYGWTRHVRNCVSTLYDTGKPWQMAQMYDQGAMRLYHDMEWYASNGVLKGEIDKAAALRNEQLSANAASTKYHVINGVLMAISAFTLLAKVVCEQVVENYFKL